MTYCPGASRGTAVDTITAPYLARRAEVDPVLDGGHSHHGGAYITAELDRRVEPGRPGIR